MVLLSERLDDLRLVCGPSLYEVLVRLNTLDQLLMRGARPKVMERFRMAPTTLYVPRCSTAQRTRIVNGNSWLTEEQSGDPKSPASPIRIAAPQIRAAVRLSGTAW